MELVTKCSECQDKPHVVYIEDNVLAYIAGYIDQSSHNMLEDAVVNHYDHKAISTARTTLRGAASHLIPDYTDLKKSRTSSNNRERFVAETRDIVGAMGEMWKITERAPTFPRCIPSDIKGLPHCAPEAANWMTVMDQLRAYERDMANLKSSVEANKLELLEQRGMVTTCEQRNRRGGQG